MPAKVDMTKFKDGNPWDNVGEAPMSDEPYIYTRETAIDKLTHFYNLHSLFGDEPINEIKKALYEQNWTMDQIQKADLIAARQSMWMKDSWVQSKASREGKRVFK